MAYGHAERNLTLIRQLEAETRKLLGSLSQLDPEQSAWLREATGCDAERDLLAQAGQGRLGRQLAS